MKTFRCITTVVATSALLAGAVAPSALAQTAGTYPTDAPSAHALAPGKKGKRGPRKLTDAQLTTVATALGTTLDALKVAQAAVKTATDATDAKETKAEKDALLATALNVTVTQLRAAFAGVHGSTDGKCKPRPASSGSAAGSYPTDPAA